MRVRLWAGAGAASALAGAVAAFAQTTPVERPATLVVGQPATGARTDRVDGARTGRSRDLLPTGALRSDWREPTGAILEHAPVVDARGTSYVVGTRGEVVAVARDGSESWRASTSAVTPSAPALLSSDTLVFVGTRESHGWAFAVQGGTLAWRTPLGRERAAGDAPYPAPLPLDDGGVVVATTHDLAELAADGRERSRFTLPEREAIAAPLVSALGRVVVVTASGAAWAWTPGTTEASRLGAFSSAVEGGAALADDHTLVAITGGGVHLEALDLVRGTTATRAVAPAGLLLGPPAMRGPVALVGLTTPTADLLLSIDGAGTEVARAPLGTHPPPIAADGGVGTLVAEARTPPLVDAAGTCAFATPDGKVGVVAAGGGPADLLADVCTTGSGVLAATSRPPAPASGLAPLGAGALVVACRTGTVVALHGAAAAPPPPRTGTPADAALE